MGIGLKIDPASENNLIPNPSFEVDASSWNLEAPSWTSATVTPTAKVYAGSSGLKALRLQATKDASATLRIISIATPTNVMLARAGVSYTASTQLNVVDAAGSGVLIVINWYDAAGVFISQVGTVAKGGTGVFELAISGVAPAGTAFAAVTITASSTVSSDTVDLYFDAVEFVITTGELDLNDGAIFRAMKAQYPTPARKVNWAQNADTEGAIPASLQYEDRQITIECRVVGSSASDLQTQLGYLEQKIGKINEADGIGGTHEYVSPSGAVCIFDLLEGAADYELDNTALANKYTVVTITFTAKPFWRSGVASETVGVDHVETTLPCVIGVDPVVGGDVPALGRLVIDNDQEAADQLTFIWGTQSRYYSAAASAELFYQAESRTPLSGAATAALGGASGAGSNTVKRNDLLPSWQAILSTQASGGGSHLSHIGTYRVFARIQRPTSNNGAVSVCLEWGQGDFLRHTRNESVDFATEELEGVWTLVDLGLVHLDKVTAGTQRWEGRFLAKSTSALDDIYVDCLMLFPVDEGYGSLKITPSLTVPSSVSAHDEFDQGGGGVLAGKVAPAGGTWSEALHAGSFNLNSTNHYITRTAVSDSESLGLAEGRVALLGTTEYTDIVVGVDMFIPTGPPGGNREFGVTCRYGTLGLVGLIAPAESVPGLWRVGTLGFTGSSIGKGIVPFDVEDRWLQLRLAVSSTGRWEFWCNGILLGSGSDTSLATGGEKEKGKIGIYDQYPNANALTRIYDNFVAYPPAFDAAVFSKQSAEVRAERVQREDASGTLWVARKDYKGSYFTLPPSRREGRSARTIVKLSRGNTDTMADSAIDDASFKVFWQSRGLVLPES
jgi:hypothetical protein